tara:strand:- start:935 stop:1153 length:219 start_codon:yes stop_codon:yes gene_type:complete
MLLTRIQQAETKTEIAHEIALFAISILLSAIILRFLWNHSLVKHVTALKEIKTILDAIGLSVALAVVRGACA